MISENIIIDTVKRTFKKLQEDCLLRSQVKQSNYQQFLIFMNDNIEYLQALVVQRRFCQLQTNSPVMAKCKTGRKDSCKVRHVSISENVLISCHGRFKSTKKSSLTMS